MAGIRKALIASAVAVVAAVAVVGTLGLGGGSDPGPSAPPRSGSLVAVRRTTLAERTTVDGQLGYGPEIPLPVKATGTVTWLPRQGAAVERGGTLLRVDDRPVVLLYGTLPMYRTIGLTAARSEDTAGGQGRRQQSGASATPAAADAPAARPPAGMDVLQFETNLAALGYTGFTVDERFTGATAAAVKRWQQSLGLPRTGRVGVGDVVYSSGRIRIGHAGVRLGAPAGQDALTYTGSSRKAVVDASASDAAWAVRGARVRVGLPGGTSVRGTVASVGKRASAARDGGPDGSGATIKVTVAIRDQKALGRLESGPVTVEYVGREARNVLSVPVAALVALAEGGYGLETASGTFVAVKTGLFADGNVEVRGSAVHAGMKVRVPR